MPSEFSHPDEPLAHKRARYLESTTNHRAAEADAVAYAELGFSLCGIAKQIDSGESNARSYLERTIAAYGPESVYTRATGEFNTGFDLAAVKPRDVQEWPEQYVDAWLDAAGGHPERAPDGVQPEVPR